MSTNALVIIVHNWKLFIVKVIHLNHFTLLPSKKRIVTLGFLTLVVIFTS